MKKTLYGLFALLLLISCKKDNSNIDYAIISGKITNKPDGVVTLNSYDRSYIDTLSVADDGSFIDTLKSNFGHVVLFDGKTPAFFYVQKGNNITIEYDSDNFTETVKYSGNGVEVSNYLLIKSRKTTDLKGEGSAFFELEEDAYKSKAKEIKTTSIALLDSIKGISTDYIEKEKRNLEYEYLASLNMYESYHAHYAKKPDFKVSDDFLKEMEGLDYTNEEDFIFSNYYASLVSSHYTKKANDLMESDSTMSRDLVFLKTFSSIPQEVIKNKLLYNYSQFNITYTDDFETFYKTFMEGSSDEKHKEEITKTYTKLKAVAKGQPSPKFFDYENYKGGTTSLDDLKGKYVYIDVWATWCGPCIAEVPFLKEVEKKYHNKNIEFVSLSIDAKKDYEKWKNMVSERELKGIQLFADNSWNSKFVKDYQIMGIPRFILIDPEGNIVNSNAPRPSDKKLITLFDELNI